MAAITKKHGGGTSQWPVGFRGNSAGGMFRNRIRPAGATAGHLDTPG